MDRRNFLLAAFGTPVAASVKVNADRHEDLLSRIYVARRVAFHCMLAKYDDYNPDVDKTTIYSYHSWKELGPRRSERYAECVDSVILLDPSRDPAVSIETLVRVERPDGALLFSLLHDLKSVKTVWLNPAK